LFQDQRGGVHGSSERLRAQQLLQLSEFAERLVAGVKQQGAIEHSEEHARG
jgi:hypothetical protein